MKTARFTLLLAASALAGLAFASQPSLAQQSDQPAAVSVPLPDYPAPVTIEQDAAKPATPAADSAKAEAKPDAVAPTEAAKTEPDKNEPKKDAAAPATEPAKAAAAPAAPAVSPTADTMVADQLRDLIGGKQFDRIVGRKADREGVEKYYREHDFKPLWVTDGATNARAKAAIGYLAQVDTVGLDPADYPVPDFKSATTASALAEDELRFTASVLTYARHAQIGRIHFSRVGGDIEFKLVPPEPAEVLAKLADASDTAKALDGYNPPQPEFKALREKLAELRAGKLNPNAEEEKKPNLVKIPEGKILRVGMKDARVPLLRQRLNIGGDKDNQLYDQAVSEAVKAFQTQADIGVDGNLGPNTTRALNGEKPETHKVSANPIDTVIVNMERWRWFPRDLGNPHVIVNVPDYTLTLYDDGKPYWKTKIVAGKPGKATPMVSAEMKFITVNPTWNVPPSIIENEYLPALQQDPDALDRIGLKVTQDADGTVHISQPPGAGNALGRIRFNFPNKFLVYQHDTPDKYLFAKTRRAYSHGCMRVQNPEMYAEKLLSLVEPKEHYTESRIEKMFGGSEININFPHFVWVHLTYQTAFVDENGKLQLREDVYGRDAKMISILKGSERKVADIAIERPPNTSSKPVRAPIGMFGGSGGYSGPSFFDFLFGGARASAPPYQPTRRVGPRYGRDGRVITR